MIDSIDGVDQIVVAGAPAIPGLHFRLFRGEADYPLIAELYAVRSRAFGDDWFPSVEELRHKYEHPVNFDPSKDLLLAFVDQTLVSFSRRLWSQIESGPRAYTVHWNVIHPDWHQQGLEQTVVRYHEDQLRALAADHGDVGAKIFQASVEDFVPGGEQILLEQGYTPVRYIFELIRDLTEPIADVPLPPGIEVRPGQPDEYRAVWEAECEAFHDEWGYSTQTEVDYQRWLGNEWFQPHLWQIGWDGDQVAGMVQNFILDEVNRAHGVQRGYTEGIGVRRPWRRMGLARALLTRSLTMFRDMGMTEAALGADADSPTGALRLYQSVGFKVTKRTTTFHKPLS